MYSIKSIFDKIVEKYNEARKDLRFDGEYLNYFAALVGEVNSMDIDVDRVKKIRRSLSEKTSWHSSFRGGGLYIVSVLLSIDEKGYENKIINLVRKEAQLVSMGFREGSYLALASYILEETEDDDAVSLFNDLFKKIKKSNFTITCEEDYPVIALMVAKGTCHETIEKRYKECFNLYTGLNVKSSNVTQDIVNMSLVYNYDFKTDESIIGVRIEHQFAVLYPIFFRKRRKYSNKLQAYEENLESYPEMNLFMDSSFRKFLAFALVIISEKILDKKEANGIIALCILNFIKTQEVSVLSEIT